MDIAKQAFNVILRILEREEQARLDAIAWEGLRKQLIPIVALALLRWT